MKKFTISTVFTAFFLLLLFYAACTDSGTDSQNEIILPDNNLNFVDHIQPLFFDKCATRTPCHSQVDQSADLILTDYNSIIIHTMPGGGNLVLIGDTTGISPLYTILLEDYNTGTRLIPRMPLEGRYLNANQTQGVKIWIAEGAVLSARK